MITVPLWLAAAVTGWAGIATLLWIRRVVLADQLVDRVLERELGRPQVQVARRRAERWQL